MSTPRGIFESFPNPPAARATSPFAVAAEPEAPAAATSPSAVAATQDSPFTLVDEARETRVEEPGRPGKRPDRRHAESPFQLAEPPDGFGFEAPAQGDPGAPFAAPSASPFASGPAVPVPSAFAPASRAAAPVDESGCDSFAIRQLALRAIFGVDRELTSGEILQRCRALPGVRNLARVSPQDMAAVEALKQLLPKLGFGGGALKLYSGSVPLEFIREGSVLLAVQADGGFAPGVRETLMLAARELGRLA